VSEQVPGQSDRDDTREWDASRVPDRDDGEENGTSDADEAARRQEQQEQTGQESAS